MHHELRQLAERAGFESVVLGGGETIDLSGGLVEFAALVAERVGRDIREKQDTRTRDYHDGIEDAFRISYDLAARWRSGGANQEGTT